MLYLPFCQIMSQNLFLSSCIIQTLYNNIIFYSRISSSFFFTRNDPRRQPVAQARPPPAQQQIGLGATFHLKIAMYELLPSQYSQACLTKQCKTFFPARNKFFYLCLLVPGYSQWWQREPSCLCFTKDKCIPMTLKIMQKGQEKRPLYYLRVLFKKEFAMLSSIQSIYRSTESYNCIPYYDKVQ